MCLEGACAGDDLGRREFLLGGAALVGLGTAGAGQDRKSAPTRVLDDPNVRHAKVTVPTAGGQEIDGFLARPKADGRCPAVLVIAGNRITEEYIPNTCAALALAGFVGLAPNIFHPLPDSAKTDEDYERALKEHTKYDVLQDIQVGADYLKTQPFVKARNLGII